MFIVKKINRISFVFPDCIDGFYDNINDCEGKCGHCKGNDTCTKDPGYCPNGCKSNFFSPMCQGNRNTS